MSLRREGLLLVGVLFLIHLKTTQVVFITINQVTSKLSMMSQSLGMELRKGSSSGRLGTRGVSTLGKEATLESSEGSTISLLRVIAILLLQWTHGQSQFWRQTTNPYQKQLRISSCPNSKSPNNPDTRHVCHNPIEKSLQ